MTTELAVRPRPPEEVLQAWWREVRADPALGQLMALVPQDRELTWADAFVLAPAALALLQSPQSQVDALSAVAGAYCRATG